MYFIILVIVLRYLVSIKIIIIIFFIIFLHTRYIIIWETLESEFNNMKRKM